jgi:hypothetical protein
MKPIVLLTALALTLPLAGAKAQPWTTNNLPPGLIAWWQAEGDLLDSAGAPFIGTGGVLTTNLPIGPEPEKFFRLLLPGN